MTKTTLLTFSYLGVLALAASLSLSPHSINASRDYLIQDCATYKDQVAQALDLGKDPILAAIQSANNGIRGGHGYRAFFKEDKSIDKVMIMLRNIYELRPARGMKGNPFKAYPPQFVCLKPGLSEFGPLYHYCEDSGWTSFLIQGDPHIYLCPLFFHTSLTPIGPPSKNCPTVLENEFRPQGADLANYQKYFLIHELVHFYLGKSSLNSETKPMEVYPLNECVAMDYKNALKNPMHFQYFVAMVEQNCIDEPNPFKAPFWPPMPSAAVPFANGTDSETAFDAVITAEEFAIPADLSLPTTAK